MIKPTLPSRSNLNKAYKHHLKTKSLRCKLPIVDLSRASLSPSRYTQATYPSKDYDDKEEDAVVEQINYKTTGKKGPKVNHRYRNVGLKK